jgi:WhiB family transcriptional regulator, redox-sensing transcriptional regulator
VVGDATTTTRRSKMFPFLEESACRGEDPELFYAESGAAITRAKSFCGQCDVRAACLEWAINREEFGVWGGTTARERAAIRRERGVRLVSSGVA